jgi:hypothetical protein
MVEAYWDPAMQKLVPARQLGPMAQAMAFLRGRFSSHRAYAEASVEEVLGPAFGRAKSLQASWLEATVFLNRGDRFEARVLPLEAQMAPAFGICAGDWNGDGHEDLLLAQNFFAVQPETPRYDAGRGSLLLGDGQGGFRALSGQESGLRIYGEQRGAAACDYDHDGRLDVVVGQNRAETKLYRNVSGRAGLRVRLVGTKENPVAVGAVLRLIYGDKLGPARELHAGSGYWSQSALGQVLAGPEPLTGIWVRWPGGRETRSKLPEGARALEVDVSGTVQQVD